MVVDDNWECDQMILEYHTLGHYLLINVFLSPEWAEWGKLSLKVSEVK